jgi:hypothetical protein
MKKFLLKIAQYGFIALLLFNAIAWCNLYFLRNSSFYKPQFLYHEVKETNFDYIVIGSSIGLTGLNTIQMDSLIGTKGINLCIDDTGISSNYLMLQHFYNQKKQAKYCVLAMNHWDLATKKPELSTNDYRFLPFVSEDFVYDYYSKLESGYFKPLAFSKYLPMIGVAYYNSEIFYPSLVAKMKPNKRNRFDEKGNYSYPVNAGLKEIPFKTTTLKWNNPYVDKIKELCDAHNTELIIYQAPIYKTKVVNSNTAFTFVNHSDLLNNKNDFYNAIHVNKFGRKKVSAEFAVVLQNLLKTNP